MVAIHKRLRSGGGAEAAIAQRAQHTLALPLHLDRVGVRVRVRVTVRARVRVRVRVVTLALTLTRCTRRSPGGGPLKARAAR